MKHNKKTNAARRLDELKIEYRIMEYPVDEEHLDAVHVAAEVGMPASQVFKTLVVRGDKNGIMFAVIPGDGELDLKALARASGNKRAELVHLKEVLPLTGYIRGGCSPLGAKRTILYIWMKPAITGRRLQSVLVSAVCRLLRHRLICSVLRLQRWHR